jgi:ribose transport system ATP-binding protein
VTPSPPLLEARGIRKRFAGVQALDGVSAYVGRGETLAVVGENGAGKSTLMKVIAGVHSPDAGEVLLDGVPVRFGGVADAMKAGIVLIHQELNLALNLSIAANIFLGRELVAGGPLGWLSGREMDRRAAGLLERVGLAESPRRLVGELTPGQRQQVEIARALSLDARLIIMDEPTSSLTQRETDQLYTIIDDLKKAHVAVLYISHRLGEVRRVADRVTVLRDGRNAGELARAEVNHDALVRLMVGRDLRQFYPRRHGGARTDVPPRLTVEGVTYAGGPATPVSFEVRSGEIVGLAGLVGAGRTELAEALYGIRPVTGGRVLLDGEAVRFRHPSKAIAAGLLLVPEDRRHHGLILEQSIRDNLSLPNFDRLSALGWVLSARENDFARDMMQRLSVRAFGPGQTVGHLSGGNQQKVVLGKWVARQPRVLIFDEPTRGVDVGARSEIYALMDRLATEGTAVLMISSDLEEVLGMSDRVLVLHEGRLAGQLGRAELSEEAVMHLATGGEAATAPRPKPAAGEGIRRGPDEGVRTG